MNDEALEVDRPLRVAYTLEQCWHQVPGGTAIAALRVASALNRRDDVSLEYVAGRHPHPPLPEYRPTGAVAMLPLSRSALYEAWNRLNWPKVESVTGPVDLVRNHCRKLSGKFGGNGIDLDTDL